jgi:regulator of sigma E protease
MIMFYWGETYTPTKNMTYGMKFNSEAKALGFHDGDILVGNENGEFREFGADLFRDVSKSHSVNIIRDGKPMTIHLSGELNLLSMIKNQPMFMRPLLPATVDSVIPNTPAEKIGLSAGDKIVALN